MFKSNKEQSGNSVKAGVGTSKNNSFGSGTVIEGKIMSEEDVRIDGRLLGTIHSKAKVVIGSSGSIDGDVHCQNAIVEGKVQGQIEVTELLFLKKSARIEGDIIAKKLVVEEGAKFNGTCRMGAKSVLNGESIRPQEEIKSKSKFQKETA